MSKQLFKAEIRYNNNCGSHDEETLYMLYDSTTDCQLTVNERGVCVTCDGTDSYIRVLRKVLEHEDYSDCGESVKITEVKDWGADIPEEVRESLFPRHNKELIHYHVPAGRSRSVVSIAGRNYIVVPYETYYSIAPEYLERAKTDDALGFILETIASRMADDIYRYLRDAEAFTAIETKSDDTSVRRFRMLLPALMPEDTCEKWATFTEENSRRRDAEAAERMRTFKPHTYKLMEWKED